MQFYQEKAVDAEEMLFYMMDDPDCFYILLEVNTDPEVGYSIDHCTDYVFYPGRIANIYSGIKHS